MTYSEKLKNPLWQKKRLDVLNRDQFTCQLCSDTTTELHVHHKEYSPGHKPWEYEDDNFQTLCKHCHSVSEKVKSFAESVLIVSKKYDKSIELYVLECIVDLGYRKELFIFCYDENSNETERTISFSEDDIIEFATLFEKSKNQHPSNGERSRISILPK